MKELRISVDMRKSGDGSSNAAQGVPTIDYAKIFSVLRYSHDVNISVDLYRINKRGGKARHKTTLSFRSADVPSQRKFFEKADASAKRLNMVAGMKNGVDRELLLALPLQDKPKAWNVANTVSYEHWLSVIDHARKAEEAMYLQFQKGKYKKEYGQNHKDTFAAVFYWEKGVTSTAVQDFMNSQVPARNEDSVDFAEPVESGELVEDEEPAEDDGPSDPAHSGGEQ